LLDDLIQFLNETKTQKGKRIVLILEQLLEIESMTKPIQGIVLPALSLKRTDPKKFRLLMEIDRKRAFLERALAEYRFIPCAEVVVGGNGGASEWSAWWRADHREKREEHLRLMNSGVLELILKLTQIGYLTRLRRCTQCQKWLYAKYRHQNFCSTKCQQKNYTQSPEWKAYRRRYMRDRYDQLFSSSKRKW
jgi:hypothetical protein